MSLENQSFYCIFEEFIDLDSLSIKKVDANGRYYGLQLLESCLLFSTSRMRSLRFRNFSSGMILPEKSIGRIRIEKRIEKMTTRWPK